MTPVVGLVFYAGSVDMCVGNTQAFQQCSDLYVEWLQGRTKDLTNLLMRALTLNQDEIAEAITQAATALGETHFMPRGNITLRPGEEFAIEVTPLTKEVIDILSKTIQASQHFIGMAFESNIESAQSSITRPGEIRNTSLNRLVANVHGPLMHLTATDQIAREIMLIMGVISGRVPMAFDVAGTRAATLNNMMRGVVGTADQGAVEQRLRRLNNAGELHYRRSRNHVATTHLYGALSFESFTAMISLMQDGGNGVPHSQLTPAQVAARAQVTQDLVHSMGVAVPADVQTFVESDGRLRLSWQEALERINRPGRAPLLFRPNRQRAYETVRATARVNTSVAAYNVFLQAVSLTKFYKSATADLPRTELENYENITRLASGIASAFGDVAGVLDAMAADKALNTRFTSSLHRRYGAFVKFWGTRLTFIGIAVGVFWDAVSAARAFDAGENALGYCYLTSVGLGIAGLWLIGAAVASTGIGIAFIVAALAISAVTTHFMDDPFQDWLERSIFGTMEGQRYIDYVYEEVALRQAKERTGWKDEPAAATAD